jgi:hypothetical protein
MASSGMLRRVDLVRTYVSEEHSASSIRVTRIGELGTTLAAISNRRTLRRNTKSQKTSFFIVAAVKTSNLTREIKLVYALWDMTEFWQLCCDRSLCNVVYYVIQYNDRLSWAITDFRHSQEFSPHHSFRA